ncbi:MAG: hypothetical protein HFJ17_03640 [Clostridia bacterium]|nr:hypothetical protein [Clostridia bacterium]
MNNKELYEKFKMMNAISNFEKEEVKLKTSRKSISKTVATFLLVTCITGGLVYATGTVVEKVWKNPEGYKINNKISQEEKEQCISEEEARNIGNSYLKKIGFEDEVIHNLALEKSILEQENIWSMSSDKVTLDIDGKTGKIKLINIPTWNYKIPYNYGIDRIEARKVAKELLEKYRPEGDEGEYEFVKLTRNMETDKGSYIWYAYFYKKYGNLLNPYENIQIGWIPTINRLYSLSFENNNYENNEEKISKEDAIKIATEKDKQIETKKAIKETKAEIQIEQMNEKVYLRENFKDEYEKGTMNMQKTGKNTYELKEDATFYKTEKRVRKVWVVVIKYDVPKDTRISEFSYYVDCTTGEIIGGSIDDSTQTIKDIISDPYNLIEK